jgi:hypothetical protein
VRTLGQALLAALCLGLVMALGDYAWAALQLRHHVVYGLVHGAVMCLCLGIAIGVQAGRPAPAALAGPIIGVVAAGAFYLLAPMLRMAAMFPAWMLFWVLFALLQQALRRSGTTAAAVARGSLAAVLSGLAFYSISSIWTGPSHDAPNVPVHFAAWSFAFLPGFLVLFRG